MCDAGGITRLLFVLLFHYNFNMAKRKQTLDMPIGTDVTLIGISCHLKSYRISFAMNEALGFEFNRMEDFEIPGQGSGEMLNFPFFVYEHDEWKNHFCLVANHHPQGKLLPGLKQVDYFLMAKNSLDAVSRKEFMGKLRMIKEIRAAYEIDPLKTRDIDILMQEMEIHLLSVEKREHPGRKR